MTVENIIDAFAINWLFYWTTNEHITDLNFTCIGVYTCIYIYGTSANHFNYFIRSAKS